MCKPPQANWLRVVTQQGLAYGAEAARGITPHFASYHMGDVFFNKLYPFIDASSGGTIDGVIAAVDRVLAIATDKTKIIPGHGPLGTRADLSAYRDMLATVAGRIKAQIKEGRNFVDIVASKPTADFDNA